ncbi:MAG: serine/threonine protein kinase [Roseovarius sp.]|uniref:serine/threonine protein kinase n=1 Tax=Roseovarius sp. TaxID=1486281 RepID=UPI0032ECDFC3
MSFLPYTQAGWGGWVSAMGVSSVAHGAFVLALMSGLNDLNRPTPEDPRRPDFVITLDRLDSDTLAGIAEREGAPGAEAEKPSETLEPTPAEDPESLTSAPAAEPETVEPEAPTPVEPEPEEIAGDQADAVEPVVPETADAAEALTPETIAPDNLEPSITPDMETDLAETVTALPVESSPIIAETIASGTPGAETATALPVAPEAQSLSGVSTLDGGNEVQTISVESVRSAALAPPPAAPQPSPPPAPPASAQDLAIGDLMRVIRAAPPKNCLIALPRRDGADAVGLALLSAEDSAMSTYAEHVLTGENAELRQTRTLVDPRQCPALDFIRQNKDYPATRLGLRIDNRELPSGGRLTGILRGTSGRYVTLLLVDNNGVVQDLQRFLSFSGNFTRFDVPVTLAGPVRDTGQLLIALATRRSPTQIKERAGQLAEDVFADLRDDLESDAALAVSTFDLR